MTAVHFWKFKDIVQKSVSLLSAPPLAQTLIWNSKSKLEYKFEYELQLQIRVSNASFKYEISKKAGVTAE